MRLKVNSCGTDGAPAWRSEPRFELVNIMADDLTLRVVESIVARLRRDLNHLMVSEPAVVDDGAVVTLELHSDVSPVYLREQTHAIHQIIGDELTHAGIPVAHLERG